jgi:hypothetical protein
VCRPKHVEQLRNIGIINSTTRLHLVGSYYEICITMHGSMNFMLNFILHIHELPQPVKLLQSLITNSVKKKSVQRILPFDSGAKFKMILCPPSSPLP